MDKLIDNLSNILESVGLNWTDSGIEIIIFLIGIAGTLIIAIYKFGLLVIRKLNELKLSRDLHPYFTPQEVNRATEYFIQTRCQNVPPSVENEPGNVHAFVTSQKLIPFFLRQALGSNKDNDHRFYLILADSGMGKTTFMINLYLSYLRKNWPFQKGKKIKLLPLGHFHSLKELSEMDVQEREQTILLLDAFDEDVEAMRDHKKRLTQILDETWRFRKVIITCRTQFFSSAIEEPGKTGISKSGGEKGEHLFYKLYLSPFSDSEVKKYLRKKFSILQFPQRKKAFKIVKKSPNLMVRPMLLNYIDELITPSKYNFFGIASNISFSLVGVSLFPLLDNSNEKYGQIYEIYRTLIGKWIEREGNRKPEGQEEYMKELHNFSRAIALNMYEMHHKRGGYFIENIEILKFASEHNINLNELEMKSRSLLNRNPEGMYKFSHKSIMEYFLAREALENKEFRENLNPEGLDTLIIFLEEQIESKWLLKNKLRTTGNFSITNFNILPKEIDEKSISLITYKDIPKLTYLTLKNTYLPSIYFLVSSTQMRNLTLNNNLLVGCGPLENMKDIAYLDLSVNQLEHCEAIGDLINLKHLRLSKNQLKSAEVLGNLSNLELLYLHDNNLTECNFICELKNLKSLTLSDNPIDDLSPIFEIDNLETLFIPRFGLKRTSFTEIAEKLPNCEITVV